jgi:hypothetical protein
LNAWTTLPKPEFKIHLQSAENRAVIALTINKIMSIIAVDPCLVLPHLDVDSFIVWTDTLDFGIGATLRQVQPVSSTNTDGVPQNEERILAYLSRKLYSTETCYSTYDKELLVIKDALKQWWYYL